MRAAPIVATMLYPVAAVVIVKVAEVAPAGIATDAGVTAFVLVDDKVTERPPAGAGPEMLTVPTDGDPPTTVVGLRPSDTKVGAVIVRVAFADWPFADAPIVLDVFELTATVEMLKVTELEPAGTVTLTGTVAAEPLALNATARPPVGAFPLSVTVPVEGVPPTTELGDNETPVTFSGLIVRAAFWLVPFKVAVIVADVVDDTLVVLTVKVAVVAPAVTVTEVGTVALEVPEPSATTMPPVPAAAESVTVPVEGVPAVTVLGLSVTLRRVGGVIVRVAV